MALGKLVDLVKKHVGVEKIRVAVAKGKTTGTGAPIGFRGLLVHNYVRFLVQTVP